MNLPLVSRVRKKVPQKTVGGAIHAIAHIRAVVLVYISISIAQREKHKHAFTVFLNAADIHFKLRCELLKCLD